MRRTHVGLCSSLPLSLIGPKPAPYPDTGGGGIKEVRVPLGGWGIFPQNPHPKALDFYYTRAKLFRSSN